MKKLLIITAILEAATGLGLLIAPAVVARLLLDAALDTSAAITIARVAAAALVSLAIACWLASYDAQGSAARGAVTAMTFYNIAAVAILAFAGTRYALHGVGLWPAVILHAVMTVWSLVCLRAVGRIGLSLALAVTLIFTTAGHAETTPAQARTIAKEAYIYGYPMIDGYRILHTYCVNRESPEFKAPWNEIKNTPRVFTPDDKAVQTPNSDTPYSSIGLDLRAEPIVLTVPSIEKERYFSVQLIDLYTHNFDYIGSRTTGNDGGSFLIAGSNWKGATPKGVKKVIRAETELVLAIFRTQLLNPADLDNVKKVQAGYKAEPLSKFLGQAAPPPAPPIDFIKPPTPNELKSSPQVFSIVNFLLQFCPTVPSEAALMERFAKIGVGAGKSFDLATLSPEVKEALSGGVADAWNEFAEYKRTQLDTGKVTSGDVFGTRETLRNDYLNRMSGAILGIFGNSKAEAMYPLYTVDASGGKLDGTNRYALRFAPGEFPPVNAFWSLTMYELPASLLTANPLKRYLLNSPMLPQFSKDADGGVTLVIQNESPGKEKEGNWLPAPKGSFFMAMRLYWPKEEATSGKWTAPKLTKAE
jgi:hypothetical protein